MFPSFTAERRALQLAVLVAGLVPVSAGLAGVTLGAGFVGDIADVSLDSHFRYLSGLLLGLGLAFWAMMPRIERHVRAVRMLTFLVVLGGFARLAAVIAVGVPDPPMLLALAMELLVTPALCLWQARIARLAEAPLERPSKNPI
jgi:hypothetical protein